MESLTISLVAIGGLLEITILIGGLAELATVRTIRPPEHRTFSHIRLTAFQFQTIIAPALAALTSGLLVSIAASFFYQELTTPQISWYPYAGAFWFLAAAIILVVILRFALKGAGDPSELANNPFTIRAAAEEYAADPGSSHLTPGLLSERLDEWESNLHRHSLNISRDVDSSVVKGQLDDAANATGVGRGTVASLKLYFTALSKFPIQFGWPLLSPLVFLTGVISFGFASSKFEGKTWWYAVIVIATFLIISAVPILTYSVARGNRARLWHRINRAAIGEARKALERAEQSKASVAKREAHLERVLERADTFLAKESFINKTQGLCTFRLGRLSISIDRR